MRTDSSGELACVACLHFAFLGALGGDEDYTAGGTCTVDGAGRCVFEHVDRLHVFLVDCADIAAGHAIDYHERALACVYGSDAAELEAVGRVRRGSAGDGEAGYFALEGCGDCGAAHTGIEVVGVD